MVYYPSIGGRVSLMRLDTGEVDALIVHDEEAPRESLRAIQNALEAGRSTVQNPVGMTPMYSGPATIAPSAARADTLCRTDSGMSGHAMPY